MDSLMFCAEWEGGWVGVGGRMGGCGREGAGGCGLLC